MPSRRSGLTASAGGRNLPRHSRNTLKHAKGALASGRGVCIYYTGCFVAAPSPVMLTKNPAAGAAVAATHRAILLALFLLSGCAALIYQVAWQRMLFAVFGVDMESVSVIVSVFMFGLGVGALLGGIVADRFRDRLLLVFTGVELGIGIFGLFSPGLIDLLNASVAGSNRLVAALGSFAVLSIPTILMGSTLPVLVTHANRFDPHIGQTVGQLYFANTAGAAMGAYLVGYHLLRWVELTGAVYTAAAINVLVASTAMLAFGRK